MKAAKITLFVTAVFTSGCIPQQRGTPFQAPTSQQAGELAKFMNPGTSTIQGQAFMKTRGGSVIYGAGSRVYLVPNTGYTTSRGSFDVTSDPALSKYTRQTKADATGNFEFLKIPEGKYIVISEVTWDVPSFTTLQSGQVISQSDMQGGTVQSNVEVGPGQTVKAVLTD